MRAISPSSRSKTTSCRMNRVASFCQKAETGFPKGKKRTFTNDVTQVRGGRKYFYDTMLKGVSKAVMKCEKGVRWDQKNLKFI